MIYKWTVTRTCRAFCDGTHRGTEYRHLFWREENNFFCKVYFEGISLSYLRTGPFWKCEKKFFLSYISKGMEWKNRKMTVEYYKMLSKR